MVEHYLRFEKNILTKSKKKVSQSSSVIQRVTENSFAEFRTYDLEQGFSTFWYLCTPKSKLYPSPYPQIRLVSPSHTPN
jgi:hypothetical protein